MISMCFPLAERVACGPPTDLLVADGAEESRGRQGERKTKKKLSAW